MMAESNRIVADVCIVGGGPAGTTTACRLAALGHKVCLVDGVTTGRSHLAATLTPGVFPMLELIGVLGAVKKSQFLKSVRVTVWWSTVQPIIKTDESSSGLHVDRKKFDAILVEHAKYLGVQVLRPAKAQQPKRMGEGGWRTSVDYLDSSRCVESRFIVDATGGRNLLGGKRIRMCVPLVAVYGKWCFDKSSDSGTVIEAGENEWYWYSPTSTDRLVASVFVDPKRLARKTRSEIERFYLQAIKRFRLFPTKCTPFKDSISVCDASSRYAENLVGLDFIKVGDAAFSSDPLSSQGVQSAISTGLQAAVVANTLIKYPQDADLACSFYHERQRERRVQHSTSSAKYYAEVAQKNSDPFWRKRDVGAPSFVWPIQEKKLTCSQPLQLSTEMELRPMASLDDDRIVSTLALQHPSLKYSIAYVGGVKIAPLIARLKVGLCADEIVGDWKTLVPESTGRKIINWLWKHDIVVPLLPERVNKSEVREDCNNC